MDSEDAAKGSGRKHSFMAGLKDPRALVFAALYFGLVMGIYGLSLWLPSIVKAMGDLSTTQVGFIVPIPYICAAAFVFFWSRHSDRTGERVGHASGAMLLGAIGLVALRFPDPDQPGAGVGRDLRRRDGHLRGDLTVLGVAVRRAGRRRRRVGHRVDQLAGQPRRLRLAVCRRRVLVDKTGDSKYGLLMLAVVLFITAAATFLYGRKITRRQRADRFARGPAGQGGRRVRPAVGRAAPPGRPGRRVQGKDAVMPDLQSRQLRSRPLRSEQWYDGPDPRNNYLHRAWMRRGVPDHAFDGRPQIAIANTASDLTPCNAHFDEVATSVKQGVYEAGGIPLNLPVMSPGETQMRPTAMLWRNLAAMSIEEMLRGNPVDGVVLARRLRQDHPGAADGGGVGRPAGAGDARRADARPGISAVRRWAAAPTCGGSARRSAPD